MKIHYYAETDSLYIDLAERSGSDSREVAAGVVADFDEKGQLVGTTSITPAVSSICRKWMWIRCLSRRRPPRKFDLS